MADQEDKDKKAGMSSDSGLGNLPPLSDFDSQDGLSSDSGLPPMSSFDSGGGLRASDSGGLPPISDIQVETPQPTGGAIKPPPPGFRSGFGDTFSSGSPTMETPAGGSPGYKGFQDLAADSDFSPETPEIGPGPDSNVDTPMFDSAFGGGDLGFDAAVATPAPTQAMETPLFGGGQPAPQPGQGFDRGAFGTGGGGFDFDAGTPPPDFSPDTEMRGVTPVTAGGGKAKKGGGGSPMLAAIVGIAALVIGIIAGPFVSGSLTFLPNPVRGENDTLRSENSRLTAENRRLAELKSEGPIEISPEEAKRLQADIVRMKEEQNTLAAALEQANASVTEKQGELQLIERDISEKNEEFVTLQDAFENLQNETAIIAARQRGLIAEVERLTNQVGQLDEAHARSVATKEALAFAIDRLYIQVKEGMPLTPERYAHASRVAAVASLRDKVAEAKWVTPALQDAYTRLYLSELELASASEYFFAKVRVTDKYGNPTSSWAECLMLGNRAVLYRTLDGKNIGRYENLATGGGSPIWGFREDLPAVAQKEIEANIVAARVPDYLDKVAVLAQKQLAMEEGNGLQRAFSSL